MSRRRVLAGVLLIAVGIVVIVVAAWSAIAGGYAADASGEGGNLIPELIAATLGLGIVVVGIWRLTRS